MGSLESPPSFVSPYNEFSDKRSVSLTPTPYLSLGYPLKLRPGLIRGSFFAHSVTLNTEYYKKGTLADSLIAVTVDAGEFLSFRKRKNVTDGLNNLVTGSISNPDQTRRGGGLGISVALPKRLNKIFGEGGAGLRVSGYRKIMFSGRSQWTDAAQSEVYRQSKFPSLNMQQLYRFDIKGTIGSKISVNVSEDSQQDIPLANRLIIRYKGDEDDILKSIEAGNTNLSLPNSGFAGYSSRVQGLFGVKSEAQIGRLRLIGIASQEQGSSERVSITPTGEASAEYIRDYNYTEGRIFDLGYSTDFHPGDSVLTLFVYQQVDRTREPLAQPAVLAVNPSDTSMFSAENIRLTGSKDGVMQLDESAYTFYSLPDSSHHYIVFYSRLLQGRAVGVYMKIERHKEGGAIDTVKVGHIPSDSTWFLKLLYHNSPSPDHKTWGLMWRNCYEVHGITARDIDKIKIYKGAAGSEGTSSSFDYQEFEGKTQNYIEILGLDQYNTRDQKYPDSKVDDRLEIYRSDWGLLIFPSREPFASDTTFVNANGVSTAELEEKAPQIYSYHSSTEKTKNSKYYIQIPSQALSSVVRLGRTNIIEGSERVTVNGSPLQSGRDYTIQYDLGQITLLSEDAQDPNADVQIDFEYAPFLALQKKTLLGLRAEYEWSKDLNVGATFLYKSDKAQDRKPRVGQETTQSMVFDVNSTWRLHPNFLTSLADALPLVETESPSNMAITGELAQSHPNPNVDNVAYVDDFEAAQEQLSLGTSRTTWKPTSIPIQVDTTICEKGKILWHTPRELRRVDEIYEREARQGEGTIHTLRVIFRPQADSTHLRSWAGIMRGFYNRIDAERVQLLELRAKISNGAKGKLHFDIGSIDEDLNGDGVPNTEDNNTNGALDFEEDVGLDGLPDEEEVDENGNGYDLVTNPDPSSDNWYFLGEGKCPLSPDLCNRLGNSNDPLWNNDSIYYEWLNGTEGNLKDPGWLSVPDEETLTRKGQVTFNRYFSFVIDLAEDSFRVDNSDLNGWWTYRIPIKDPSALDTIVSTIVSSDEGEDTLSPVWNEVSHVRVWFESEVGQTEPDTIEIADWYFVQSNWEDSVIYHGPSRPDSTSFVVASISEEDSTFYPPPGVEAYKDPNYNVTEAQRGLLLKFDNLDNDDTCLVTKHLITVEKYSGYRRIQMYVHGSIKPEDVGKVKFFFRIGKDANNFYEQHTIIDAGWNERNYINIDFNEITALKDAALRTRPRNEWKDIDTSDGTYQVRGNPNINEVQHFVAGIENLSDEDISGEIWLDELRVTDVRKDVGTAGRLSITGSIADLINYNFSFKSQDAFFRGLSSATRGGSSDNLGSGETSTNISYGGSLNFDRFLPRSWGARIPISVSHSKSTDTPLLRSNSDIVLPKDVQEAERSIRESNSFRISESFNRKGKNPLFNLLLNRFNSSLSYSRTSRRDVNTPYSFGESYSIPASFDLSVGKVPTLPIFFWMKPLPFLKKTSGSRLGLYPSMWKLSGTYSRNISITDDINLNRRTTFKRDFTGKMDVSYKVFDNLSTSFNYTTLRDLSDVDQVNLSLKNFRLGLETRYSQLFSTSYDPKLFGFVSTGFSYKASYSDNYSRSNQSLSSSMSRTWSVNGSFDHIKLLGGKKSRSEPRRSPRHGKSQPEEGEGQSKPTRPFYDPPLALLRFLTGWIKPLSYSYSEGYNSSLPGMVTRPAFKYRLGFVRDADVATLSEGRAPSSGEDQSYQLSSGFTFLGGLSTDVKFRQSISRDLVKQGTRYKDVSTSWPDLSIRIQKFQRLPLLQGVVNKFIDVFSPRTGYNRQIKERFNMNSDFLASRTVASNYSPLLSINFKVFRSLSLSGTYTLMKNRDEKYNPTDGSFQTETRSSRSSMSISTKYSFSSPSGISLPLFGRIKFKSTVSISVNMSRSTDKSESRRAGGGWALSADKSDFKVSPEISYSFSSQIRGGLYARWQDSSDNFRNRKSHTRELQGWVEIRF